jgi:hypothetical protein
MEKGNDQGVSYEILCASRALIFIVDNILSPKLFNSTSMNILSLLFTELKYTTENSDKLFSYVAGRL